MRTSKVRKSSGSSYVTILGLSSMCHSHNELRYWEGKSFKFPTPIDSRMRVGDHVYLFWGDDELYGRGIIEDIGDKDAKLLRPVRVHIIAARPGIKVREEISSSRSSITRFGSTLLPKMLFARASTSGHFTRFDFIRGLLARSLRVRGSL
jgi:hypothetical protein